MDGSCFSFFTPGNTYILESRWVLTIGIEFGAWWEHKHILVLVWRALRLPVVSVRLTEECLGRSRTEDKLFVINSIAFFLHLDCLL